MRRDVKKIADQAADLLVQLLAIPSPTGFCDEAISFVSKCLKGHGLQLRRARGGALTATMKGRSAGPARAVTCHVDTIGLCVRGLKPGGRLTVSPIGGVIPYTVEGEYCRVRNLSGKLFRGTVMPVKSSLHVHKDLAKFEHTVENLEVRLDERVSSDQEVRKLGIDAGDFIFLDTRTEITESGFIKSRHLDDKAGVAAVLSAVFMLAKSRRVPSVTTHFHFAVAEETGFGASSGLPGDVGELLVVDMGAVGPDQQSDEYSVSVCMKDSWGPYDSEMSARLIALAEKSKIPVRRDIFPYYGSDRISFMNSGGDARIALFGPGVDASHAFERSHKLAVGYTAKLLAAYLSS